jgi:hypothetical protein
MAERWITVRDDGSHKSDGVVYGSRDEAEEARHPDEVCVRVDTPSNVIYPPVFGRALASEAQRRYELLDEDGQRLVVRLADGEDDFACLSAREYRELERAGLIEVQRDSWDWTPVGAEVAALVRGMRGSDAG